MLACVVVVPLCSKPPTWLSCMNPLIPSSPLPSLRLPNGCMAMALFFFLVGNAFPAISLEFTVCGEISVYVTVLFNSIIEVVLFHLRSLCMLGVFLLPVFTCVGHEYQVLLSLCKGIHVCTN